VHTRGAMSKRAVIAVVAVMVVGAVIYLLFRSLKATAPGPAMTAENKTPPPAAPAPAPAPKADEKRSDGPPPEMRLVDDDDPVGGMRLEGQVIDEDERPVGGALVQLSSQPRRTAKTQADGSFEFDKLIGRAYSLEARKEDGIAGPVTVRLTNKTEPVILRLVQAASLEVTVLAVATRKPVPGAKVSFYEEDEGAVTTGADGKARLRGVGHGWQGVEAVAPGYAREVKLFEAAGKAGSIDKVTVELRRGAPVSGQVVDAAGKAVAGAHVTPVDASSPWAGTFERDRATTDGKGKFKFDALAAGTFRFEARHGQHAPGSSAAITLDGQNARTDVTIRLADSARIAGRVVSKSGQPVSGAGLRVAAKNAGYARQLARQAYTDDKGRFDVTGLPRAPVQVVAIHDTASSSMLELDLGAEPEKTGLTIVLDVDGAIAGIVVTAQGDPVPEAQVTATPELTAGAQLSTLRLRGASQDVTDSAGKFELTGLPKGTYRLRAMRAGGRDAWMRESTSAQTGQTDVKLVLAPDGKIKGKVLFDDGSAPAAYSIATGWGEGVAFGDSGGAFSIDAPAGPANLTVSGPGFVRKTVSGVEVKGAAETDVGTITVERGRSISGRVLRADGSGVAGAKVMCGPQLIGTGSELGAGFFGGGMGIKSTQTDDDGSFTLSGVGARTMVIAAEHPTDGRSPTVRLVASTESATVDLVLRPFAPLEGKVTSGGKPVSRSMVTSQPQAASRGTFMVQTGEDGSYRFDKLAPDVYVVTAMEAGGMMGGRNMVSRTVTVGEQGGHLDIDLPTGGVTVTVGITPPAGAKVTTAQVLLVSGKVVATTGEQLAEAVAERGDGSLHPGFVMKGEPVKFEGVVPGAYSACAVPIPGDINSPADMVKIQQHLDKLVVACIPATVAESPAEQSLNIPVPVPPVF
jgi:uncharacterized GH25 family protein